MQTQVQNCVRLEAYRQVRKKLETLYLDKLITQ
jgi:hypothetical protein